MRLPWNIRPKCVCSTWNICCNKFSFNQLRVERDGCGAWNIRMCIHNGVTLSLTVIWSTRMSSTMSCRILSWTYIRITQP